MILYGIKNCDTVKKARAWLDVRGVAYEFHDYKIAGIEAARLRAWVDEFGWEKVLNRAGTTFRKLADADKAGLDADKAVALMLTQPSMIKRPLLDLGDRRLLGFAAADWEKALSQSHPGESRDPRTPLQVEKATIAGADRLVRGHGSRLSPG